MKKFQIKKMILPIAFISFLTVSSLITFLGTEKAYSENEKRILSEFPDFTWENFISGKLQENLETYISDHIAGREFFVGVDAYYSNLMGKNALGDVYMADDGYLINAPKDKTGKENYFEKNINNIETFSAFNPIPSSLVIVPSAGYVMEDKLPMFHKKYSDASLFKKASDKTSFVGFLDVREHLIGAYESGYEVYYKTDHHLTARGSYELYKAYCDYRGLEFPSEKEYTVTEHDGFYGTTYSSGGYWLSKPDTLEVWDLGEDVKVTIGEDGDEFTSMFFEKHLENQDKYPLYLDGNHAFVKIENPNAKGGNLLLIRDSFGQSFAPFLAHNYKTVCLVDMRYFRKSMGLIIEKEKIDEILFLYGIETLIDDDSTSYLFF